MREKIREIHDFSYLHETFTLEWYIFVCWKINSTLWNRETFPSECKTGIFRKTFLPRRVSGVRLVWLVYSAQNPYI